MLGFYECTVLIHELVKSTAVQGFMSFIFHAQADKAIGGKLDSKNSAMTCEAHRKHSISCKKMEQEK